MIVLRVLVVIAGAVIVLTSITEAIRAFVLPRGASLRFSRWIFVAVFRALGALVRVRRAHDRKSRDAIMVYGAPLAVLCLPVAWLFATLLGYSGIFWAIDKSSGFGDAFVVSGSSLLTLGFDRPPGVSGAATAFSEAGVGLALLAVVISYLPSLNSAFSRREALVAMLDARAGTPPDGVTLIERHLVYATIDHLDIQWPSWEEWIVDVGVSHSTHPMLTFFRSADPDHSWVTATLALVDAANFRLSAIQRSGAGNADAFMFYRAATTVLERIDGYFRRSGRKAWTRTIEQPAFNSVLDRFAKAGVEVADRDAAWERFSVRRAHYEPMIGRLTTLLDAPPPPPWASR
jgi:hypothetical protein